MTVVPESRGNLGALRTPDLSCCRKLAALPESVGNLGALQTLDLDNCYKLKTLPAWNLAAHAARRAQPRANRGQRCAVRSPHRLLPLTRDCTALHPHRPRNRLFGAPLCVSRGRTQQ
jgi:hypothetical protein